MWMHKQSGPAPAAQGPCACSIKMASYSYNSGESSSCLSNAEHQVVDDTSSSSSHQPAGVANFLNQLHQAPIAAVNRKRKITQNFSHKGAAVQVS